MLTKKLTVQNTETMVEDFNTLMEIKMAFQAAGFTVSMSQSYGLYHGEWTLFKGEGKDRFNNVSLSWDFPLFGGYYSSTIRGDMVVKITPHWTTNVKTRVFKRTKVGWKVSEMVAHAQASLDSFALRVKNEEAKESRYQEARVALEPYGYGFASANSGGVKLEKVLSVKEFQALAPKLVELGLLMVKPEGK